jgi:hypothetical protein
MIKDIKLLCFDYIEKDVCSIKNCNNTNISGYILKRETDSLPYCEDHKEGEVFEGQHIDDSRLVDKKQTKVESRISLRKCSLLFIFVIILAGVIL